MQEPRHSIRPVIGVYVITRFGNDPPRLIEVARECTRFKKVHGRDVLKGGPAVARLSEVLARHTELLRATDAFEALKDAIAEQDAAVRRAYLGYTNAQRQREKALTQAASGLLKAV